MIRGDIKQKKPSDVYDDWQRTVEALKQVPQNALLDIKGRLPAWAQNLSFQELNQLTDNIVRETDLHYALGLIASIEGVFNDQIKSFVSRKSKDKFAKRLRQKFKKQIESKKQIRFDDILDTWKDNDPRTKVKISELKKYLEYRHWLAHGRHWDIHYWNCPDPNDVYMLYDALNSIIVFDLSF